MLLPPAITNHGSTTAIPDATAAHDKHHDERPTNPQAPQHHTGRPERPPQEGAVLASGPHDRRRS